MFAKNEGPADRAIRVVAGIVLIAVGLFPLAGLEVSALGIAVAAFGLWFIVTGAIGVCPAYVPFGITTVPKSQRVPTIDRSKQAA
jgi:uncharacterized membrane protein HdeD (DUF308 family)